MSDTRFILQPNLPNKRVKVLIIGEIYGELLSNKLDKLGITALITPNNPILPPEIASHADMSVCHMGFNKIIAAQPIFDKLHGGLWDDMDIIRAKNPQDREYPQSVGLNACIIGDRLLHNLKLSDETLTAASQSDKLRRYNVHQGYTKCSVCVVDRGHIITADNGIHKIAQSLGIQSLLIRPGGIDLKGYSHGFIGGCGVKLDRSVLAFTGKLDGHPDKKQILTFIADAGVETIYLTDKPLFDVGSMIPIIEET